MGSNNLNDIFNFDKEQLRQIKIGKEKGLDVREYAKTKYSWEVMRQIRMAMENGINHLNLLADLGFDWEQLREIRRGYVYNFGLIEKGKTDNDFISVDKYKRVIISADKMKIIRKGLINGVDVIEILNAYSYDSIKDLPSCEDLNKIIIDTMKTNNNTLKMDFEGDELNTMPANIDFNRNPDLNWRNCE